MFLTNYSIERELF
jgi:hypothetical protein